MFCVYFVALESGNELAAALITLVPNANSHRSLDLALKFRLLMYTAYELKLSQSRLIGPGYLKTRAWISKDLG